MINRRILFIGLIGLFSVTIGCANLFLSQDREGVKNSLLEEYLQKARTYKAEKDKVSALKQYKLALTLDPSNKEAVKNRKRIEKTLRSSAREHYNKGLQQYKKGKYSIARWRFLIALRLWPDYTSAEKMLTARKRHKIARQRAERQKTEPQKTEKYTVHKIKTGESLSKLAKKYYGDPDKFLIIAEYNNITDATLVKVGQEIKIPGIEGVKSSPKKKAKEKPKKEIKSSPKKKAKEKSQEEIIFEPEIWDLEEHQFDNTTDAKVSKSQAGKEKEAMEYQIAFYRDYGSQLFKHERYEEAVAEFRKVLNTNPGDEVAINYSFRSHFQLGKAFFDNEVYMAARDHFKASLQYNEKCEECRDYLKKSELLYKKENHYKKGMEYYGNEQLVRAIQEWQIVQRMDPDYKRVEYLITKAKTILKKLEEIKALEKEKR
jgi:tetratricopeptide (TPR) repeat protein